MQEVPLPSLKNGEVMIKTTRSLVSLGTERMLVDFGKASLLQKAKQQPDKVKMVLDKVKSDGLRPTFDSVVNKLGQPIPLGYCNVGKVVSVGNGVTEFAVGDRVASNGYHAEFVCVAKNLVAKIPDEVTDDEAVFTVIGAIGLQGLRLLNPTLGETIVVVGLGLVGLLTAELLLANGCNVIGFDYDEAKIRLANAKGIIAINPSNVSDQVKYIEAHTNGIGVDGVVITASSRSDEIISQSAKMCRKRGRVVLVGVVGLNISRADYYEKEITFQVSCSYGPGRYDNEYEKNGKDYPIGFVRWTEKRNFEAVLNAIGKGLLKVLPLITDRIPLHDYQKIYRDMSNPTSIAIILQYSSETRGSRTVEINSNCFNGKRAVLGILGAGNFTSSTLLPKLKKNQANIKYISSSGGLSSTILAEKYRIAKSTTDSEEIFEDKEVDLVLITTRHHLHGKLIVEAMRSGKSVFVEKPLALNNQELDEIIKIYKISNLNLTVGFNRRFAPLALKMKEILGKSSGPINITATMNAGYVDIDSWLHDMRTGGGRIIGEACHFIDLCTFLTDSQVISVCVNALGINPKENTDNASLLLKYKDGSNAVVNYFSNGSKSYSKERVEVFSLGRTLVMDNWRSLKGFGFKGFSRAKSGQDKGHLNQFKKLLDQQKNGGKPIIPFEQLVNTTKASFSAIESLKEGKWIQVG